MAKGQKTDLRERKVAKTHFKVRVAGETGSQQNALRHELYTHIYERLEEANEQAMYFEIIALCDMLITDRLEAFTQYLLHYEDKEYKTDIIGLALQYLGTAINDKKPALKNDADYKQIYKRVDEFAKMRDLIPSVMCRYRGACDVRHAYPSGRATPKYSGHSHGRSAFRRHGIHGAPLPQDASSRPDRKGGSSSKKCLCDHFALLT